MRFLGYTDEKLYVIAAIELIIAIVFLARPTRVFGTMLASGYLGTIPALVLLACLWAGIWLEQHAADATALVAQP